MTITEGILHDMANAAARLLKEPCVTIAFSPGPHPTNRCDCCFCKLHAAVNYYNKVYLKAPITSDQEKHNATTNAAGKATGEGE